MDAVHGCSWCGTTVEGSNHFCSPDCFYAFYEAARKLDILEHELERIEGELVTLTTRIEEFDEISHQAKRMQSAGCSVALDTLKRDRLLMAKNAKHLRQDVECLQQWLKTTQD